MRGQCKKRGVLSRVLLLCLMFTLGNVAEAGSPRRVSVDHEAFNYKGSWAAGVTNVHTPFAGSQVLFKLKGRAKLFLEVAEPECIRIAIVKNGETIFDEAFDGEAITIDG